MMFAVPALSTLETSDLVRRLADADLAFIIKHALVQDTAYGSLLKNERKRLHRLCGEALEELYPEGRSDNAARLAQHFAEAGDDTKLALYAAWAGDDAARIYATEEALRQYKAALEAALRINASSPEIIELSTKLGRLYELKNDTPNALAAYARLSDLAVERNDPSCELASLMLQATLRATPTSAFDPIQGQEILDRALALARELNDGPAQAKILWNLLLLNGFTGRHAAAIAYGEQSLALARVLNLKLQTAYTLNDLANYGYFSAGHPEAARASSAEARAMWRELDNLPMLSDNLNNSGIIEYLMGNMAQAQIYSDEALQVSERTENAWGIVLARSFRGCLAYEAGNFGSALTEFQIALALSRSQDLGIGIITCTNLALLYAALGEIKAGRELMQFAEGEVGIVLYRAPSKATLAYLAFLNRDLEGAEMYIREAQPRSREELEFSYLPNILANGEYYLSRGEGQECLAVMQDILERLSSHGLGTHLADAELYLARAYQLLGDYERARRSYARSEQAAQQVGSRRALLSIYIHWAQLEHAENQIERAGALALRAGTLRSEIAATLPERYRQSFIMTNPLPGETVQNVRDTAIAS